LQAHSCASGGRIKDAIHHYEGVIDAMAILLQPEVLDSDRQLPDTLNWIVTATLFLAKYRDRAQEHWGAALSNYKIAEKLQNRLGKNDAALNTELEIQLMRFEAGRFIDQDRISELALQIETSIQNRPETADIDRAIEFNNLALSLRQLGLLDEAEKLCIRALAIDEQQRVGDHPKIAHRLNNLSAVQIRQGKLDEAATNNEKAWHIQCGKWDSITCRTLVIRALLEGLSGKPVANSVGRLKTLFQSKEKLLNEHTTNTWIITDVLEDSRAKLDETTADLIDALVDVFNDRSQLSRLDDLEIWREQEAIPMGTS